MSSFKWHKVLKKCPGHQDTLVFLLLFCFCMPAARTCLVQSMFAAFVVFLEIAGGLRLPWANKNMYNCFRTGGPASKGSYVLIDLLVLGHREHDTLARPSCCPDISPGHLFSVLKTTILLRNEKMGLIQLPIIPIRPACD